MAPLSAFWLPIFSRVSHRSSTPIISLDVLRRAYDRMELGRDSTAIFRAEQLMALDDSTSRYPITL